MKMLVISPVKLASAILIAFFLFGCGPNEIKRTESNQQWEKARYATKFQLGENGIFRVTEPWPGATKPVIYQNIKVPERVIVTSTTHLPFLEMLNVEHTLVGFPSTQYIYSEKVRQLVSEGKVVDLGVDGQLNLELVLATEPDVVIAFDMGNESTVLDKIAEAGIPIIYNADFLETSPLGRAEWIRLFGALFGRQEMADSLFLAVESRYDSLNQLARNVTLKPTVFSGVMYGDTWFLPGGKNWAATFFTDAGGNYLWSQDSSSGWLEISFESVMDKAIDADYWIGTASFTNLTQLKGQDARYSDFKAFQQGNVYSYHAKMGPGGGFDIFESGYARPDLVLQDMILILHPELLPNRELFFYKQLPD